MTTSTPGTEKDKQWLDAWQETIEQHFDSARARVDPIYQQHFASLSAVVHRHWQHRGDVPKDLMNLPRGLWRLGTQWRQKNTPTKRDLNPTGKELALINVISSELLQIDELQKKFHQHIQSHADFKPEEYQKLDKLLSNMSAEEAREKLQVAVERLRLSHEGSRDLFIFVSLGLVSRSLADKIAFGGAAAIGSSLATSAYLSQKTFLGALWASWFGAPGWVTTLGAAGGMGAILIATPIISPFTETGINRIRAKKTLHQIIDETETRTKHAQFDAASATGQVATYLQLLPDLVQLIKQIR